MENQGYQTAQFIDQYSYSDGQHRKEANIRQGTSQVRMSLLLSHWSLYIRLRCVGPPSSLSWQFEQGLEVSKAAKESNEGQVFLFLTMSSVNSHSHSESDAKWLTQHYSCTICSREERWWRIVRPLFYGFFWSDRAASYRSSYRWIDTNNGRFELVQRDYGMWMEIDCFPFIE